ncbi:MAG: alpha/beta fold hydrolase, partial [Novosphingobium sp.]
RFLRRATASTIDARGVAAYEVLMGNPRHCAGAMEMMANWDLEALCRDLPKHPGPVLLIHSSGDAAIPLPSVQEAARRIPHCHLEVLPELGHLAHEERPDIVAEQILGFARQQQEDST